MHAPTARDPARRWNCVRCAGADRFRPCPLTSTTTTITRLATTRTATPLVTAHSHGPANYDRAFAIGIALNVGFVVVEAVYGVVANSLALLADAGHNLGDVLGLVMAWGAATLVRRRPTARYTYGLKRSSILVSLANAGLLLLAVGAIVWEAVQRLGRPEPVAEMTVIWVAMIGIAINGATALLFMSGRKSDLNIKGAFLHMAADAVVSLGVVIAALAIMATGLAVARSRRQPGHRRRHHGRHLVAAARFAQAGARCGSRARRSWRDRSLPGGAAGRHRRARPAHLGDEHDRGRDDGPPGPSRRHAR